jgi:hypothetical protein
MAAHEHINQNQLSMLMPAHELHSMVSSDAPGWSSPKSMWAAKKDTNDRTGLTAHVAEHGVHNPVTIAHGYQDEPATWDGHHRIQAAFEANPNMEVPVSHIDVNKDTPLRPNKPVPDWDEVQHFPSLPSRFG